MRVSGALFFSLRLDTISEKAQNVLKSIEKLALETF
jgi:hypothetical protein